MLTSITSARLLSGLTLLAIVSVGFVPPATAGQPASALTQQASTEAAPGTPPERSAAEVAESAASQEAATSGTDVIVEELTTPTEQVVASPDGKFTKTISSEPVRMLSNGTWAQISTDLEERDGVLKPKMVPAELSLGKGGSQHMSSVADGKGHSVTESWPYGALPAAQVKGNTATYPGVLPGVDLIQVAKKQGISQVLKIYTPEAARDPRVVELKLKLDAANVNLSSDGKGGLKGQSQANGEDVLRSSAGRWWDSRHEGVGPTDPGGPGVTGTFDLSLVTDAAGTHEKLGITAVTARTDLTYPIYIDPDWSTLRASYLYIDSAFPNTSYWNGQYTDSSVHVGFLPAAEDYDFHVNHSTRGFWQFSTSPMVGKKIFAARFNVTNVWSYSCSARTVRARVTGAINPSTTWNTTPGNVRDLDAKSFAYGYSGCGASTVGFDMAPARDLFPTVAQWTVGLFADNEHNDPYSWKRFANDANIIVTYGTPPNTPQLTAMTYCSFQCPGSGLQPGLTRFDKPGFSIYASDPDGNADGAISVWAAVKRRADSSTVWSMQSPIFVPGTGGYANWDGPYPMYNNWLRDGEYFVDFQISDNTGLVSPKVRYDFNVDTTPPPAPIITPVSTSLVGDLYDEAGTVGQTIYDFKLTISDVDPVQAFIYALTSDGEAPTYPANLLNSACGHTEGYFTLVCPADGRSHIIKAAAISRLDTRITAWSVDPASNVSNSLKLTDQNDPASNLDFDVGHLSPSPTQELSISVAGAAGTATAVAIPASSSGPTGSCAQTVTVDETAMMSQPQTQAPALLLNGGYGTTAGFAADPANSFTVSGWFCPTAVTSGTTQPVITQLDAAGNASAQLGIGSSNEWELATRTTAGTTQIVKTGKPVNPNAWYFVNAVYDKVNRQLRIAFASQAEVGQWTVAIAPYAHAPAAISSPVLLGANSATANTARFRGIIARPALTSGVLVQSQLKALWAPHKTLGVLK